MWKMPPRNVPPPVMEPRTNGLPRPVRSPVSESPSEKAMLTPAPIAVASPVKNAVRGSWVASTTAKIGASVESRAVHQAAQRRLHALKQEGLVGRRAVAQHAPAQVVSVRQQRHAEAISLA